MEKYGARVELLSRFVPMKKQKEIIEDIKKGSVDLIVGTHRLLSEEEPSRTSGNARPIITLIA